MVTVENITDERIRELRGEADAMKDIGLVAICCDALGVRCDTGYRRPIEAHKHECESAGNSIVCGCNADVRSEARARCAELINARAKEPR